MTGETGQSWFQVQFHSPVLLATAGPSLSLSFGSAFYRNNFILKLVAKLVATSPPDPEESHPTRRFPRGEGNLLPRNDQGTLPSARGFAFDSTPTLEPLSVTPLCLA